MTRRLRLSLAAALLAAAASATPAHALRVVTWNVLDYRVSNLAGRQASFRAVLAALDPDVLITQELNEAAAKESLLANVLNVVQPGQWTGTWLALGTEGGGLFWKSAKVAIPSFSSVPTGGPRPVMVALVKPAGYLNKAGWFRVYSVHFKAGNPAFTPADSTTRRVECTSLRTTLNDQITTAVGPNFVIGGDTNFYGSWEGGYARLVESQLDNDGRSFDPLSLAGTWNNSGYAPFHTQSPRLSSGGMDDRFDLWLTSQGLRDGNGLDLLPGSTLAYGNDGLHYNDDIDGGGFNTAVGLEIATALRVASDHIPVLMQLQLPAKVSAASQVAFGDVIVGAAGVTQALAVANAAVPPADNLRYSFAAPAGFSAPAGTDSVAAGAAAKLHPLGLDASTAGLKAGTLTLATNDVDSAAKAVQLSARVLAHAVPSLDSLAVVTSGSADFGDHVAGGFADLGVRVHDRGWNALQARLAITGASIGGGDGRFSLVGFTPVTVGAVGHTFNVHFDAAGASLDSTYHASLVFTTADEPLPGAAAAAPLTVSLRAHVGSSVTAAGGDHALRLSPPRPNPARAGTEIAFELPREAPVDVGVYDLGGRRVATLAAGRLGAGHHSLRWNAQDEAGRRVAAGLYFVRFTTPGLARVLRVAVLP